VEQVRGRLVTLVLPLGVLYGVWGSTYLAIRIALETMPPFLQASVRFAIAGVLLFAFSIRRGDHVHDRIGWRQWLAALIVGGLLLAGGNGGVSWGEQYVSSGLAALMVATVPLWIVVFSHIVGHERITWPVGIGVAIGLVGVALLADPTSGGSNHLVGIIAVLVAPVLWAAGSVYARNAALPRRPLVATSIEMLCGAGIMAVAAVATGELGRVHFEQVSLRSGLALAYLVFFGSILAFSCYVWLLKTARPSIIGTYAYVNPAIAVALGWLVLGEPLTPRTIAGGAIIILGVALIVTARSLELPRFLRRKPIPPAEGGVA
jgi:drug/metabolite transporter (DMT)-like permease